MKAISRRRVNKVLLTNKDINIIKKTILDNKDKFQDINKFNYKEVLFIVNEYLRHKTIFQAENDAMFYRQATITKYNWKKYKEFIKYLLLKNLANFDTTLLINGQKGTGKSSAAIILAQEWCRLLGIKFDPNRHIAYTNDDIMYKIETLNKFEPLICDEAITFITTEDWNKRENKDLKQKLGMIRTKHLFFIFNFPMKITKVDRAYLENYVNYWIYMFDRGKGSLFVRDDNPGTNSWNINYFEKMYGTWNEFSDLDDIEKKLNRHPNFWMMFEFPKVAEDIYNKYLVVREKFVYEGVSPGGKLQNTRSLKKDDVDKIVLLLFLNDIINKDPTFNVNKLPMLIKKLFDYDIDKKKINSILNNVVNTYEVWTEQQKLKDLKKKESKVEDTQISLLEEYE